MTIEEKIKESANQHVRAYSDLFWGELIEFINKEDEILDFDDRLLVIGRIANGLHLSVTTLFEKRLGLVASTVQTTFGDDDEAN